MGGVFGGPKPQKQAAPVKAAAPVKREDEDVRQAKQNEMRRAVSGQARKSTSLLKSNYGSEKKSLLG